MVLTVEELLEELGPNFHRSETAQDSWGREVQGGTKIRLLKNGTTLFL